jgi:hypothetical protein
MIVFGSIHFQNPDLTVSMKFVTWIFEAKPIALILAIPFAIGILTGAFIFVPPWMKKAGLARHQKKRIHELESELGELGVPTDMDEVKRDDETITAETKED